MRGGSKEKSKEKVDGLSLEEEEDDALESGEETWMKAWAGGDAAAAAGIEESEAGMRNVAGRDFRQALHGGVVTPAVGSCI